jgi:hypothetical protein
MGLAGRAGLDFNNACTRADPGRTPARSICCTRGTWSLVTYVLRTGRVDIQPGRRLAGRCPALAYTKAIQKVHATRR